MCERKGILELVDLFKNPKTINITEAEANEFLYYLTDEDFVNERFAIVDIMNTWLKVLDRVKEA